MSLKGYTFLVTAGPTYEPLDPVRFLGNHSSGKMGYAIAETLADKKAHVYLVSGPTNLKMDHPNVVITRIQTAQEMYEFCYEQFPKCNGAVLAAAVSDYKPKQVAREKIKKDQQESLYLELERNPDILKTLGSIKKPGQILVGFSLETENGELNALEKLQNKNLDIIALNLANNEQTGFGKPTNQITLFDKNGSKKAFPVKRKTQVAHDLVDYLMQYINTSGVKEKLG